MHSIHRLSSVRQWLDLASQRPCETSLFSTESSLIQDRKEEHHHHFRIFSSQSISQIYFSCRISSVVPLNRCTHSVCSHFKQDDYHWQNFPAKLHSQKNPAEANIKNAANSSQGPNEYAFFCLFFFNIISFWDTVMFRISNDDFPKAMNLRTTSQKIGQISLFDLTSEGFFVYSSIWRTSTCNHSAYCLRTKLGHSMVTWWQRNNPNLLLAVHTHTFRHPSTHALHHLWRACSTVRRSRKMCWLSTNRGPWRAVTGLT